MDFKKAKKIRTFNKVRDMLASCNPDAILSGRYYVAVNDGRILGCVGLERISWYLTEIKHLFVREEFRGTGVGRFLVDNATEKVKTPLICCTITEGNDASMRLFSNLGFTIERRFVNTNTGNSVSLLIRPGE